MKRLLLIAAAIAILVVAAWFLFLRGPSAPPVYGVTIVKTLPHDANAFTQGLFFQDGVLYESTGEVGASGIRKVRPETGAVELEQPLGPPYFGEGIVAWKDRVIQVTWQHGRGFVYALGDLSLKDSFEYKGEGWGLTQDGKRLILSDGTETLRFLDPETLKQNGTLKVTVGGCPLLKMNELEYIDGEIWANIWQTNLIARIDPASGKVKSFLDVSTLGPQNPDPDAVPNGIAWDATGKRLFVTGKLWPQLYEVKQGAAQADSPAAAKLAECAQ